MTITWQDNVTPLNAANMNQLEQTSRKDQANGYPALTAARFILPDRLGAGVRDGTKFLRDDGTWQATMPSRLAAFVDGAKGGAQVTDCNAANQSGWWYATTGAI